MNARSLLHAALAFAAGGALGFAAWGEGRAPLLALLLPAAIALCASRSQAFLVGAGYVAGLMRHTAAFIGTWFDNSLVVGSAAVLAYAVITGAVWSVGWSRSPRANRRAAAMGLAWLIAMLPPATLAIPGHPLVATGFLLPGWGWFGVAIAFIGAMVISASLPMLGTTPRITLVTVMCASSAMGGALLARLGNAPAADALGVQAVATAWGNIGGAEDALVRMERMGRTPISGGTVAVVWPESILGRYEPSMYPVLDLELLEPSKRAGRTHVIGMDIPLRGNRLLNAAVAFYPDGGSATAMARQPAPLSLWKPWKNENTFVADWTAHNVISLGQGDKAAVIFCYEEYLPALYLLNEAFDRPTVYVAMRNTWAAPYSASSAIQTWHSLGMARLFGRPYVMADNRPRPTLAPADWTPSIAP